MTLDTRYSRAPVKMTILISVVMLLFVQGALGQLVKVDPEVMSYPGQNVELPCQFINPGSTQVSQVSWILEPPEGERINVAVFHPTFGASYPDSPVRGRVSFTNPTLDTPSIQIADVKMTDEGRYICEYATYPTGNAQGITNLVMLAKPRNSASPVTVAAGDKPVTVARCESANGRPAAQIRWETVVNGNATTLATQESDNTVTIRSEYKLRPTPADNGKDISCVVVHRTQAKPESFTMKLTIEYPPMLTIVGYDNNWYVGRTNVELTCQAKGNPPPTTVVWRTLSGVMPDTVQISENKLKVLKVDETVNTTFVCEVRNRLGAGKDQVTVNVRDPPANPSNAGVVAGVVIGSLLALLLVGALVAILVTHNRRQQQQGYRGNQKNGVFDIKSRLFGSKASKNGGGPSNGPSNNNGPIYTYREGVSEGGLTEKANHGLGGVATAQDILLSGEMDEAERKKFDELEDEEERYDHFTSAGPILQLRHHDDEHHMPYLDDDMESQRDGSVISRTAVYV
ncbi:poliovirus receptor homolog [Clupea harengus]|uniref:Nectin cell adhesion molecule 3 n=1 Tax=Clupea harengus TaxID=7950 RepID=A0A6P8G930_CLUHA|nr:poliovirus receptor homolog [Clupea harengus]